MAAKFTASLTESRWKEHQCVACGSVYRYLFEQSVFGAGSTRRAAEDDAEFKLQRAFKNEVETRACPSCGLLQPDMIADLGGATHGCLLIVLLALFAVGGVIAILIASQVIAWPVLYLIITWSTLIVSMLAVAVHFLLSRRDLNADRQANMSESAEHVAAGTMTLEQAGRPGQSLAPPQPRFGSWRLTALLLLGALGLTGLAAAECTRIAIRLRCTVP